MDIDKLIRMDYVAFRDSRFGSLMDIDKLIPNSQTNSGKERFGSLMDIDKLILINLDTVAYRVLVL